MARLYMYRNLRRRCLEILQMVLQQSAKGRAVLPSVLLLPSSCGHQIYVLLHTASLPITSQHFQFKFVLLTVELFHRNRFPNRHRYPSDTIMTLSLYFMLFILAYLSILTFRSLIAEIAKRILIVSLSLYFLLVMQLTSQFKLCMFKKCCSLTGTGASQRRGLSSCSFQPTSRLDV